MIKIAVIGTGGMAHAQADQFKLVRGCKLVAACDVVRERAAAYAAKYGIPDSAVFTDVGEMLATVDCDAVTNVTIDAFHAPISLQCIAAGKHVLCEKPLAVNYADARKMAMAAKRKGVINMVNLSYRNSSAIQKAHKLVAEGAIGRVMHFEASYLQCWLSSRCWGNWRTEEGWLWRLSSKHGSKGVLGDVGVHILDFATFPAGDAKRISCRLKTFDKAKDNRIGEYVLDTNDSAVINMELVDGGIGTIHTTRWATGYNNTLALRIFGDEGSIRVDLDKSSTDLDICNGPGIHKTRWKTVKCGKTPSIYQRFVTSIKTGENDQPDFARGAQIQKIMDGCFESDKSGKAVNV
ncbi:MAG: Gfo/Idh/MocA family oxidoreductase [Sedimentisphaerales bacterium]|nr:Gfo/Idh/MocA family oxidoreductase [Sedimentisphaerales bacterium]